MGAFAPHGSERWGNSGAGIDASKALLVTQSSRWRVASPSSGVACRSRGRTRTDYGVGSGVGIRLQAAFLTHTTPLITAAKRP